jgi:hypothetical protein
MQAPDATRVAGFRAWLELGYAVRKGESAIKIWMPLAPSRKQLQAWRDGGGDPAEKPRTMFKLGSVFDVSQVSPLPPPANPAPLDPPIARLEGDELAHLQAPLERFANSLGYSVTIEALNGPEGVCSHREQAIAVEESLEANGQIAALLHELARARPRRPPRRGPELTYAAEELVVESVAYSVPPSPGSTRAPTASPT